MHFANTYVLTNFTDLITSFLSNSQKKNQKKNKKRYFLIRPQRGGKIIYLRYFIIV